jgi:hypothetical protein
LEVLVECAKLFYLCCRERGHEEGRLFVSDGISL